MKIIILTTFEGAFVSHGIFPALGVLVELLDPALCLLYPLSSAFR